MEMISPKMPGSLDDLTPQDPADALNMIVIQQALQERGITGRPPFKFIRGKPVTNELRSMVEDIKESLSSFFNPLNNYEKFTTRDLDSALIYLPPPGAQAEAWTPPLAALKALLPKLTIKEGNELYGLYAKRRHGKSDSYKSFTSIEDAIQNAWDNSYIYEYELSARGMQSDLWLEKVKSEDENGNKITNYSCEFDLGTGGIDVDEPIPYYRRACIYNTVPFGGVQNDYGLDWFGSHMTPHGFIDAAYINLPYEETINIPDNIEELFGEGDDCCIRVNYSINMMLYDYSRGCYKFC